MDELELLRHLNPAVAPRTRELDRLIANFEATAGTDDRQRSTSPALPSTRDRRPRSLTVLVGMTILVAVAAILLIASRGPTTIPTTGPRTGETPISGPPPTSVGGTAELPDLIVVDRPDASDVLTLTNGRIRFEQPAPTDRPTMSAQQAILFTEHQRSDPAVRVILMRFTELLVNDLTTDSVAQPAPNSRLVWVVARVPGNAHLATIIPDVTPFSLHILDATTGQDLGTLGAVGGSHG